MTKTGYMKSFFGPFFRSSSEDKWHWRIECINFPVVETPQTKICTSEPKKEILCSLCQEIENTKTEAKLDHSVSNMVFY